jgi:hypothetical protein
MQTLLSISLLAANVDIQSFTWLTKEKEFKKSAVITLSKEKKTEEKFLLSTHHVCFIIYLQMNRKDCYGKQ